MGGAILVRVGGAYSFPKPWQRKCLDLEDERGLHLQWRCDKSCMGSKQTKPLGNPGLASRSVLGLYFALLLLIRPCSCQDLAEVTACIPPPGVCEAGGRPGFPTAGIVLLGPSAVCVGLAVSLSGTIYADTELGTWIFEDYFLEGKGFFIFILF